MGLGSFVSDLVTKNNPVAGTIRAGVDLAQGKYKQAAGDFGGGATFGTIPSDTIQGAIGSAGDAAGAVGGAITPATVDTSQLGDAAQRARDTQDRLDAERAGLTPGAAPLIDQSQINGLRTQQQSAIDSIGAAAAGNVPSPAELQAQQQGNRAAAQQFGIASALQGGLSPGAAQRNALEGAANVQADVANNNAILRANEQATARNQLVGALSGVRGQEDAEAGQDQNAKLVTAGQDITKNANLLNASGNALTSDVNAGAAKANADANVAASTNAYKGAVVGGIAGSIPVVGKLLSDRREKTDVHAAPLGELADALKGFVFRYSKPDEPGAAPGERVGIMAQDALKGGPVGEAMVDTKGPGPLKLDLGNAIGAALAMSAKALRERRA